MNYKMIIKISKTWEDILNIAANNEVAYLDLAQACEFKNKIDWSIKILEAGAKDYLCLNK